MSTITIRKRLDSDVIELGKEAESLVGKNVEITIRELIDEKPTERKWTTIGNINLGGELDVVNVRDFAHDD